MCLTVRGHEHAFLKWRGNVSLRPLSHIDHYIRIYMCIWYILYYIYIGAYRKFTYIGAYSKFTLAAFLLLSSIFFFFLLLHVFLLKLCLCASDYTPTLCD